MSGKPRRRRAWVVTDHDTSKKHKKALETSLTEDDNVVRCIVSEEKSKKKGKTHLQVSVQYKHAKTMSAVKMTFGGKSHIEMRRGTAFEAWSYCLMECKPLFTKGVAPTEADVPSSWITPIKVDIDAGASEWEIANSYPSSYLRYSTAIAKLIYMRDEHTLMNSWRDVTVTYLHGPTGCGKTRKVVGMTAKPHDVFRVYNYRQTNGLFDGYQGQDILLLEEFRHSIPIEQMLIILDGYYNALPCRYANKMARWTQVFIATNIPLDEQYPNMQQYQPETFRALERRIDNITLMPPAPNKWSHPDEPHLWSEQTTLTHYTPVTTGNTKL